MIRVTVERPESAPAAQWEALACDAPNVFMHPTALKAASETLLAVIYVFLAWDTAIEPNKLVGWWALQGKHLLFWPYLETLPYKYAFLSTPVIQPDRAAEVMPAFMAAIAHNNTLPKTLTVRDFDAAGPAFAALDAHSARVPHVALRFDERPWATRETGLKRTGSTRKKLRQDWNRLAAAGTLDVVNVRDEPGAVAAALEAFLEMEAASWKGASGTALLNDPRDAAFARRFIGDMAKAGDASVALLRLDGKPIAAQVLLYSGRTAYTWKMAYDPAHARHSPGTLLVDRISTDLLDSKAVDVIDSCAIGEGFMANLWAGRKPMVDMVTSAGPGISPSFLAVAGYLRGRQWLKGALNRMAQRRRTPLPASPKAETPGESSAGSPASHEVSGPEPRSGRAA